MLTMNGSNLYSTKVTTVTINGAHITSDSGYHRHPNNDNWYDEKHRRVMQAVHELEYAVADLLKE